MDRGFLLTDYGKIKLFQMPALKRFGCVSHGFTTRLGGVGEPPFDTLNLAFHVGDNPGAVITNRKAVCRVLGAEIDNMVTGQQVHGVNIAVVGREHTGRGALSYDTALPDTDGLLTVRPGLILATFYADCVPVFIFDPVKKVVGSVHAGWKGTVARIAAFALQKMANTFGSRPADCIVGVGPSIGPCCYEVDEPVAGLFRQEFGGAPGLLEEPGVAKARLNLWEANRKIVVEAGVNENNVEIANICTCCNRKLLFSYRGEGGHTGRMGAFIMLKPAQGKREND